MIVFVTLIAFTPFPFVVLLVRVVHGNIFLQLQVIVFMKEYWHQRERFFLYIFSIFKNNLVLSRMQST